MTTINSHRTAARAFGIFFILAFLSYGTGSGIIDSITNAPDMLSNVYANQTTLVWGVILMAIVHSFVNIGLMAILLPILKPFSKTVPYFSFGLGIAATIILVVGAIFLLMLIPLSAEYLTAGSENAALFSSIAAMLKNGGFVSYQIGMSLWGLGGLLYVAVLYKTRLIPRIVSLWGLVGYLIFFAGTIFELFGNGSLYSTMPGGLFELFLSFWLIFKGFNTSQLKTAHS